MFGKELRRKEEKRGGGLRRGQTITPFGSVFFYSTVDGSGVYSMQALDRGRSRDKKNTLCFPSTSNYRPLHFTSEEILVGPALLQLLTSLSCRDVL